MDHFRNLIGCRNRARRDVYPPPSMPSSFSSSRLPRMDSLRALRTPGPDCPDVLYKQKDHITNDIWDKNVDTDLRSFHSYWLPNRVPYLVEIKLREAGFYGASMIGKVSLDTRLTSALVERWRPSTHTFHIPQGEITVTLKDVEILLGLPIEGTPLIGEWSKKRNSE